MRQMLPQSDGHGSVQRKLLIRRDRILPDALAAWRPGNTQYYTEYAHRPRRSLMSVRHALLALLSEGPKYGLQLRQEFEARTGDVWPLNVGQVYTTLQRLERDGLVTSDADDDAPQRGYRITGDGRDELLVWLQSPPTDTQPPRDELLIKVLVAVQVPGVDVHDVIQVHRRHLVEQMQRYTRVKADAADFRLEAEAP